MNTNERNYPERTVAVLNNGDTAIVVDDHCYAIRNWSGETWGWSSHIFGEALAALKVLPDNPDEAESVPFVWPANAELRGRPLADGPA